MRKIFTWHIHGSYLYYLSQGPYTIYIPVTESRKEEGYYGRGETFPFGDNVIEIPVDEVRNLDLDVIVFQTDANYLEHQYEILSEAQRSLPKIYIEHDPPWAHPAHERHIVDDPEMTLVHVTHYNRLMWDNNRTPSRVIEHGVMVPENLSYSGEKARGVVVINNLPQRGRMLGLDIFLKVREHLPIDLVGMGTGDLGLGEVLHPQLPEFLTQYRFYLHPVRYTSLGLSVCESMMLGLPIVGLATTELPTVIDNGVSGFVHTDVDYLIENMQLLLDDPALAAKMGAAAKQTALEKFNIQRFTAEWNALFEEMIAAHADAALTASA